MKADELKKKSQQQAEVKKPVGATGAEQPEKAKRQAPRRSLLGEMIGKDSQKVYDKKSNYYGSTFYKIKTRNIENMGNDAPAIVYAFKETIIDPNEAQDEKELKRKEEIWRLIERDAYLGKRYIIYCKQTSKGYKIYDLLEQPK